MQIHIYNIYVYIHSWLSENARVLCGAQLYCYSQQFTLAQRLICMLQLYYVCNFNVL